eukprot:CAMPEP_0117047984 /NCGR_PEP_ID=MMETSP0472-20121206/33149_1 /TAXON_ID=693140 ORGANISM="Tiarina fusus, Strain LIS" /NCGR_SAMPLE_ID=MMETSP0472 /ASSEMBLY_ACC=CAM_ASM_000603 /LENGTH=133 /DNA_ID=CAMNT_0004760869 /DNA_START=8 /DNA_END=409 /DNA_ORIENTATION=+
MPDLQLIALALTAVLSVIVIFLLLRGGNSAVTPRTPRTPRMDGKPRWHAKPGAVYTWDEIKKHKTQDDLWVVVSGKVYDVTSWLPRHPGGFAIMNAAGDDATEWMKEILPHPETAWKELEDYYIGNVDEKKAK